MTLDRAERTGFGIAVVGHVLLFAALSTGYLAMRTPIPPKRQPIEVSLVDEVGLESGAPELSNAPPAPKLGEIEGPVEPLRPTPVPTPPEAAPAPPQPRQSAVPAPGQAKPVPPRIAQRPTTGRLKGLLNGLADNDSDSRSTAPPAATITPAVQSSLAAEVRRQLKPHWKAPTGADAEQLRTELRISLARDGTVTNIEFLRQTGITPSNRVQAPLHKEQAIKAVRLASPFQLPAEYYDAWKVLSPIGFDKRLSQ